MTSKTKTNGSSKTTAAAKNYAAGLMKEYGPCTITWAAAKKFPALKRSEWLAICKEIGIKQTTGSNEFGNLRSGRVDITGWKLP